jgi:PBP1b-binding outer membrane lipoprotein LpoB
MKKYYFVLMLVFLSGCSELIAFEQEDKPNDETTTTVVYVAPEPPTEVGPIEEVEEAFQP